MAEFQAIASVIIVVLAAIFLIIGIAVVIMLLNILKNIRRVTQRVDETSENMTEIAKYMGTKLAPAAASAVVALFWRKAKSRIKRRKAE